jgi:hypothetical protein
MTMSDNKETPQPPLPPHIENMRAHLMAGMERLLDRQNPMDPEQANALANLGKVMVDSAKVEVAYLKVTGGVSTGFIDPKKNPPTLPSPDGTPTANNPFPAGQVHRLRG